MNMGMVNILKDATENVMHSLGAADAQLTDARDVDGEYSKPAAIGMSVPFYGDIEGVLACVLNHSEVMSVARLLTGEEELEEDPEFLHDVVAELVNVIVGHVVNTFVGRGLNVDFSTPESIGEDGVVLGVPDGFECSELCFSGGGTEFDEVLLVMEGADV